MAAPTESSEALNDLKVEQLLLDSLRYLRALQESLHHVRNTIPSILAPLHTESTYIKASHPKLKKEDPTPRALADDLRKAASSAISDVTSLQERWTSSSTQAILNDAKKREETRIEEGRSREPGSLPWLSEIYDSGAHDQGRQALGSLLDERTDSFGQLSIADGHTNYETENVEDTLRDWKSKHADVDVELLAGTDSVKYNMRWLDIQPVLHKNKGHWLMGDDSDRTGGLAGEILATVNNLKISSLNDLLDILWAYQELESAACSICQRKLSRTGKLAERRRKVKNTARKEWEAVHNECL